MPYGKQRPKAEKEKIKAEILDLQLKAFPDHEIIKQLKIPKATFYRYCQDLGKEFREKTLGDPDRLIQAYVSRSLNRIKRLEAKSSRTGEEPGTITTKYAQDIENSVVKTLTELGILHKAPDKLNVEMVNVAYSKPKWLDEDDKPAGTSP